MGGAAGIVGRGGSAVEVRRAPRAAPRPLLAMAASVGLHLQAASLELCRALAVDTAQTLIAQHGLTQLVARVDEQTARFGVTQDELAAQVRDMTVQHHALVHNVPRLSAAVDEIRDHVGRLQDQLNAAPAANAPIEPRRASVGFGSNSARWRRFSARGKRNHPPPPPSPSPPPPSPSSPAARRGGSRADVHEIDGRPHEQTCL